MPSVVSDVTPDANVTPPTSYPGARRAFEAATVVRRWQPLAAPVVVLLLTAVAFWIRVDGLSGWSGTLTVDEARLALASRGVLDTGLPRMPSGWIYTRGVLATYLTAPSLALLGESDFAVRLPAVLAGAALIPVAFALGREVAGRAGGLFVAAILAGHPSFVVWSRQAWFYALYILILAAALLFMLRALRTRSARDQILAAVFVGLCPFTHEVGAFLLLPFVVGIGLGVRARGIRLVPLLALALVGGALVAQWLLVTQLRASSLVGAYGEIEEYLSPSAEWSRIRFYLRMMTDGPGLMLALAVVGIPLAIRHRPAGTLLLWLTATPVFVHAAFFIPRGPQERYGLALVLVICVLSAQGARLLVNASIASLSARDRLGRRWPADALASAAVCAVLLVTLLAHQDVRRAIDRAALSPKEGSWLREVRELGIGPNDVVMTDVPTTVSWYVGGLDYWVSSRDYDKYVSRDGDVRRDVHSGAALVRNRSDFERLVGRPDPSRPLWVIASGRSYQWGELVDDELKAYIDRNATKRVIPGDNFRILLLDGRSGS
jgi:hypothetical protein